MTNNQSMSNQRGILKLSIKERRQIEQQAKLIRNHLKTRRIEIGFTQENLAEKLDVSIETIKCIEQGKRLPSLVLFLRIAKVLNIEIKLNDH